MQAAKERDPICYQLLDTFALTASNWIQSRENLSCCHNRIKGPSEQLPYRLYDVLKRFLPFGGIGNIYKTNIKWNKIARISANLFYSDSYFVLNVALTLYQEGNLALRLSYILFAQGARLHIWLHLPVCNKKGQLHQPRSLLRGCFMVDIPLIYIPTWAPEGEYEPEAHCVNKALPTSPRAKTSYIHVVSYFFPYKSITFLMKENLIFLRARPYSRI